MASATNPFDCDGLINALDPDSDNDSIMDGVELGLTEDDVVKECRINGNLIYRGTNMSVFGEGDMDAGSTVTSMLDNDTDGDGLLDGVEDKDHDGMIDGDENRNGIWDDGEEWLESDPTDKDTDDDGLMDGSSGKGRVLRINGESGDISREEIEIYDESYDDTDDDGVPNILDRDSDGDGIEDGVEAGIGMGDITPDTNVSRFRGDEDPTTITSALLTDSDNDGVPDGWIDADNDGEMEWGECEDKNYNGKVDYNETDPSNPDTDGDGLVDGEDVVDESGNILLYGELSIHFLYSEWRGYKVGFGDYTESAYHNMLKEVLSEEDMGESGEEGRKYIQGGITDPTNNDTDGDGIDDGVELGIKENTDGSIKNIDQSGYDYNRSTGGDPYRFYTDPSRMGGRSHGLHRITGLGRYCDP